jgi:hypothetical protein
MRRDRVVGIVALTLRDDLLPFFLFLGRTMVQKSGEETSSQDFFPPESVLVRTKGKLAN